MAHSEKLADRVRESLSDVNNVEEKKMFGGLAFLVNDKMCINVSKDSLMCRIDPSLYNELVKREGCSPVLMKDREYKGYLYVEEQHIQKKEDFDFWVNLSLDYNQVAQVAKNRRNK